MTTRLRGIACLSLLFVGMTASIQARADYKYTLVDYPGAASTQFWGINNAGLIVGQASYDPVNGPFFDFTYDHDKGVFTLIPDVPGTADTGAIGLNERGTLVGTTSLDGVTASAFILDKKGEHTVFNKPGWHHTRARAIGSSGKVTGYSTTADFSDSTGFIYNPKDGSFTDIDFPNSSTVIPQGINGRGDVVGSVSFRPGGAPGGNPPGTYAFLRDKSGSIAIFRLNATLTRARGITDAGTITGHVVDPGTGATQGFVGKLELQPGLPAVQYLTAPPVELLVVPGVFSTTPQGINNAGTIVGSTDDGTGISHGFIATPLPKLRTVKLTFNVTVPATTDATGRSVFIAGFLDRLDGNLPQWDPSGVSLTRVDATHWTITLTGKEGTPLEYKYTNGSWDYVEKDGACAEIANRQLTLSYGTTGTQLVNDSVPNWRNVAPCGN